MNYSPQRGFSGIPPVIKNLLIINFILFFAASMGEAIGVNLNEIFPLYYFEYEKFQPYQFVTYMFMHGNLGHILFNMLALWMLGMTLENVWGPKRFLIYYMVTGIGAALVHQAYMFFEFSSLREAIAVFATAPSPEAFIYVVNDNFKLFMQEASIQEFILEWQKHPADLSYVSQAAEILSQLLYLKMSIPTVGASGAVFGILIAFGMLFPNVELMMLFFPVPIKAKYFVMIYGALELFLGLMDRAGDNVAHFAHLGGALFGFILIKLWKKKSPPTIHY